MAKKEGKMKGKGPNKRRVKSELDVEKFKETYGRSATNVACPNCIKNGLLCVINYGADNIDAFSRNKIIVTCPVCGLEKPREDNFGEEWWIPFHLPGVQKSFMDYSERREPQPDDKDRFTKFNIG